MNTYIKIDYALNATLILTKWSLKPFQCDMNQINVL